MSQLLTEMGMGGKRNEIRGQRAQGLQRSSRKELGPTKVEKTDKADKFRGVWMVSLAREPGAGRQAPPEDGI